MPGRRSFQSLRQGWGSLLHEDVLDGGRSRCREGGSPGVTRTQAGSCTLLILRSLWTFCIHFDFYKYRIEILCSSVEVGEWAPPDAVPQPPAGGRLAPAASPCPRHTESPIVRSPHLPAEPGGGDRTAGQWPGHFQQQQPSHASSRNCLVNVSGPGWPWAGVFTSSLG